MSNSDATASTLREWISALSGGTSWYSLDAVTQKRYAELFLLEVPGHPCWGEPVETVQLAAKHLAAEAQKVTNPTLWVGSDFEKLADRYIGLGDLLTEPGFRCEVADLVADVLGEFDAEGRLVNSLFGHPALRPLLTMRTDVTLARLANAILCDLNVARTDLPTWLLHRLGYTDQEAWDAVTSLFAEFGTGPAHALWADWPSIVDAVEAQFAFSGVGQQSFEGMPVAQTTAETWMSAVIDFEREVGERAWLNRNICRKSGTKAVLNHRHIVNLVRNEVLDQSGLPYSLMGTGKNRNGKSMDKKRAARSKDNVRRLKHALRTSSLTLDDLGGPALVPLRSLVAGALVRGERTRRVRVQPTVNGPGPEQVVAKLREFSKKHNYVPAVKMVHKELGYTVTEIESALNGQTYSNFVARLADSGYVVTKVGKGNGPSATAQAGMRLLRDAFAGNYEREMSLRHLLSDETLDRNPRWKLCRVDFAITDVAELNGVCVLGEIDGEHHFEHVPGQGILSEHRERDRERHRQVRQVREEGTDAYLFAIHWQLVRFPAERGGATAEQLRAAFDAAHEAGYSWIFVRPTGCSDMRAHLGKVRRLGVHIDGIEVFVADRHR